MASTIDGSSPALSFDPASGLSDGTNLIPTSDIISLKPLSNNDEYTLFHAAPAEFVLHSLTLKAPPAELTSRYNLTALPKHLDSTHANITVILSTVSGTGKAPAYCTNLLLPLLIAHGLDPTSFTVHTLTGPNSIHEFADTLPTTKPNTLILLSGDTLIFEITNTHPPTTNTTLAIIPLGTGNALSHAISRFAAPPLTTLLLGAPRPLPTYRAHFSPGAHFVLPNGSGIALLPPGNVVKGSVVFSWGFHASLVADSDTEELRKEGVARFQVAAKRGLEEMHAYRGVVSALRGEEGDWKEVGTGKDHFYTMGAMVAELEAGFCISPSSKLGGGLWMVWFPVVEAAEVMQLMGGAYAGGTHVQDPRVRYEKVRGLRLAVEEEEEKWRRVCVDGAIVAVEKGGWVEVTVEEDEGGVKVVWRG